MLQHKAYCFRLYPSKKQEVQINKTIGCARYIYNHFLSVTNETYRQTGKGLTYNACSAMLPALKKQDATSWLSEVDSIALQSSLRDLADAYERFFNKQNQKPNFKRKGNATQSYTTKYVNNNIRVIKNRLKLPKLDTVRFANSRKLKGRIINATISRTPSNKYMISILCEEVIEFLPVTHSSVGIDLGLIDFAILSTGQKVKNQRYLIASQNKLKREQRKLSRRITQAQSKNIKLSDSKNIQKQKRKVAYLYEKVTNQRNDFLNKLTTTLIKNHDTICIEDLDVKAMLQNKHLSKSIADVSWSRFVDMLLYKANWYGREIVKIDRWFASSQICSNCSHNDGKKALGIRTWICTSCHTEHDRDVNASRNILNEGLRIQALA